MVLFEVISLNRGQSKSLKGNLELDFTAQPLCAVQWRAVPVHTEMLRKAEGKGRTRIFCFPLSTWKPKQVKEQQF